MQHLAFYPTEPAWPSRGDDCLCRGGAGGDGHGRVWVNSAISSPLPSRGRWPSCGMSRPRDTFHDRPHGVGPAIRERLESDSPGEYLAKAAWLSLPCVYQIRDGRRYFWRPSRSASGTQSVRSRTRRSFGQPTDPTL